jgi:hypothetical protein
LSLLLFLLPSQFGLSLLLKLLFVHLLIHGFLCQQPLILFFFLFLLLAKLVLLRLFELHGLTLGLLLKIKLDLFLPITLYFLSFKLAKTFDFLSFKALTLCCCFSRSFFFSCTS